MDEILRKNLHQIKGWIAHLNLPQDDEYVFERNRHDQHTKLDTKSASRNQILIFRLTDYLPMASLTTFV